jgi:ABC-type uncharacterized transport system substrate-binding protein
MGATSGSSPFDTIFVNVAEVPRGLPTLDVLHQADRVVRQRNRGRKERAMGPMKRILAVAVGPQKDVLIRAKGDLGGVRPYIEGLVNGLASLKHELGSDFEIDYREREHLDLETGPGAANAFKANSETPHDVIFAMSTTVVRAANGVGKSIPIVFPAVSDHKAEGFHRSGNVTGISPRRSQTAGECFERFLATVPTLKEVRVLHRPTYAPGERALKLVKAAAKKRKVTVTPVAVNSHQDLKKKLSALPKRNPEKPAKLGVLVLPVDLFFSAAPMIIDLAQGQKNLPTSFPVTDWVKPRLPSALGGYGVPQRRCGELAAEHVAHILWGGSEAGRPKVKDAHDDTFEWVVSSAAAKALNIKIPFPRVI